MKMPLPMFFFMNYVVYWVHEHISSKRMVWIEISQSKTNWNLDLRHSNVLENVETLSFKI